MEIKTRKPRSREEMRKWSKLYRTRNRERYNNYQKEYRKSNPELIKKQDRKYHLKKCYGMSQEEFQEKLLSQNNRCEICKKETKLCVDHNHETGKVRGLLCRYCNIVIGNLEKQNLYLYYSYIGRYK